LCARSNGHECDASNQSDTVFIQWTTNQTSAGNKVWVRLQGSSGWSYKQVPAGTGPSVRLYTGTDSPGTYYHHLANGTYEYYVESDATSGLASTLPSCGPSCGAGGYSSYTFKIQ
jgi:hypothetical protein